jgi:hypothetical protein
MKSGVKRWSSWNIIASGFTFIGATAFLITVIVNHITAAFENISSFGEGWDNLTDELSLEELHWIIPPVLLALLQVPILISQWNFFAFLNKVEEQYSQTLSA